MERPFQLWCNCNRFYTGVGRSPIHGLASGWQFPDTMTAPSFTLLLCYSLYVNPCDLSTPCVYDVDNHATFGHYMMSVLPVCNTLCSGCITLMIFVPTLDGCQRLLDSYSTYASFVFNLRLLRFVSPCAHLLNGCDRRLCLIAQRL